MSQAGAVGSPQASRKSVGMEDLAKERPQAKAKLEEKKSAPSSSSSASTNKPPARIDDRNFRNHYYEKVGFRGMDERKTLEAILKDDPINLEKCINFALRCTIPSSERLLVWKLLLGEEATYPNNRKDHARWKERTFRDTKRFLLSAGRIEPDWPTAQTLTVLWLLFESRLILDFKTQLKELHCLNFMSIAESMLLMTNSNEMEAFWLAKGLAGVINKHSDQVISDLVETYHRILSTGTNTNKLYNHMEKIGLNEEIPLRRWLGCGFAGVLRVAALERLWDKLASGALKLMPFVAAALVECKKMQIFGCQTAKEAIRYLVSADEETDDLIVQKGIEMWVADGGYLLPPVDSFQNNSGFKLTSGDDRPPILGSPQFPLVGFINVELTESAIIEEDDANFS